jgi:ribonuclease E
MTKRMLIDDTHEEETRVVVINNNKLDDVDTETSLRKQLKGNIYLGKIVRVEPSLQAAFVDYGGNRHGFIAFSEIHPDYYNLSKKDLAEIEAELDEMDFSKKYERNKKDRRSKKSKTKEIRETHSKIEPTTEIDKNIVTETSITEEKVAVQKNLPEEVTKTKVKTEAKTEPKIESKADVEAKVKSEVETETKSEAKNEDKYVQGINVSNLSNSVQIIENLEEIYNKEKEEVEHNPISLENSGIVELYNNTPSDEDKNFSADNKSEEETISEEVIEEATVEEVEHTKTPVEEVQTTTSNGEVSEEEDDEEDDESYEIRRKLARARKLYHRSTIQDVIKEGQIILVQIVKEERGNKGAALTTYLSLAGRYCVLMPNRIKSGGVSRKITNVSDRKKLRNIIKELPLTDDMSIIVRTAGQDRNKAEINRDYNYLIRTWNKIRHDALQSSAPELIHEEGNLIKRSIRDVYSKDVSEILVAGEEGYRAAKDFIKMLTPSHAKKVQPYRDQNIPLFQRYQVESQLEQLHSPIAQLESGGYLVINPTEALVAIDVNSGRATKEKDLEETALKTNLESADEVARQLRMRNLAGLVVIDFIDMEDPHNNYLVEKRMKEALKKDRARIQVGKISGFGLMELSRQRLQSSFLESNYTTCPHCKGKGMVRNVASSAVHILRIIEEEGIKQRSVKFSINVPEQIALYILNEKREDLINIENRYGFKVIINGDNSIVSHTDYKIERVKGTPIQKEEVKTPVYEEETEEEYVESFEETTETKQSFKQNSKNNRKRNNNNNKRYNKNKTTEKVSKKKPSKLTWWKRLIQG